MTNLKGSKTEANLQTAFAGESQARNKYNNAGTNKKQQQHFVSIKPSSKNRTQCLGPVKKATNESSFVDNTGVNLRLGLNKKTPRNFVRSGV